MSEDKFAAEVAKLRELEKRELKPACLLHY